MSISIEQVGSGDADGRALVRREYALRAHEPEQSGFLQRDGVGVHWEGFGQGEQTILLMPTWAIVHSRIWKFQVPYLARRFRVLVFDPRGNGLSDRPHDAAAYDRRRLVDDAVGVLEAAGVERAAVVSWCGGGEEFLLAAEHPERVSSLVVVAPFLGVSPLPGEEGSYSFEDRLDVEEGWAKYNRHYWLRDWAGFLGFYQAQIFNEPHSTKPIEDGVTWGLQTDPETILLGEGAWDEAWMAQPEQAKELCSRVRCPVLVIQGSEDAIVGTERGAAIAAALPDARLVTFEGSGHGPSIRDPVRFNLVLSEFLGEGEPNRERTVIRAASRPHPRALYLCSPIGLGHVQRDLAIARELRRLRGDLEIVWLAQHPVSQVLAAAGETIHPASKLMANESAHIERRMGEHQLHVFQAWREMDEILLANFMLFHDIVREERYDLWLGDESWELDYYLHENPELKSSPYVFMTDFVGWLPMDEAQGSREAALTADYNEENIGHVERYPYVRDAALFIGEQPDVMPRRFGPGLPFMPDWVARHFAFSGYVLPFDPTEHADTERVRRDLGLDPQRPLIVASVGGSGVGVHLLRRIAAAFELLRREVPEARLLLVCGPRIDPSAIEPVEGMDVLEIRPRALSHPRLLRPGRRPGWADHDHGAGRKPAPFHKRPPAEPLRAEPPRRPSPGPLRGTTTDALRAGDDRAPGSSDAGATGHGGQLRPRRDRRGSPGGGVDRALDHRRVSAGPHLAQLCIAKRAS